MKHYKDIICITCWLSNTAQYINGWLHFLD